jgi:hypothetical protein
MGDRANQYYTAFRRYLGQTGKDEKTATYTDLAGFLKKSNLDPGYFAGKKGIIDPAVVNQGFTKMAQDYFSGNSTASSGKVGKKSSAVGSTPTQTAGPAGSASTTVSTAAPAGSSQPFSVPALIKVIPQLNKRELTQINKAVQAALQTTTPAASSPVTPAAAPTTPTQNTAKAALLKPKKAVAV